MAARPEYRLRVFFSVDLVGSTAFKAGVGSERESPNSPQPVWVSQIRQFYRDFPKILSDEYRAVAGASWTDTDGLCPSLWKTVGDEILFCVRAISLDHLAHCTSAFMRALDSYGRILDESRRTLDVKGAAWIAAFPAPNVTVEITGARRSDASESASRPDYIDEEFESRADETPADFDFLGKEIDSGFRLAKNAAADRLAISVEMGYLLADASHNLFFNGHFSYHNREVLKGVIGSRPYPILSIDTERSASRRAVREHERALTHETSAGPVQLLSFLNAFMTDEGMELPHLPRKGAPTDPLKIPRSYLDFQKAWVATVEESTKRASLEAKSEEASADNPEGELPQSVESSLDSTVPKDATS